MRRLLRVCAASVLLLGLAGCGSGTVSDPGGSHSGAASSGPITVDTARGPVSLPAPATRVVSLEWTYTEELIALGVTPVGNADSATYASWVTAPGAALPASVTDVGKRNEPSIEQITALKPDLIVASEDRVGAGYEQLAKIAPVLSFDYTAKPQLETMKKNFTALAAAVGAQDRATEVLGRIDTAAADLAGRLTKAGRSGQEYALAQGYSVNGVPAIRMLTDDAFSPQVLGRAGLRNGWRGKPDDWGMTTVGVEGLTQVPGSVTFLSVAADNDNPFTGALAGNPVWRGLAFVGEGRAKSLDPGTWLFGGPLSALHLIDQTAKALGV
ncbi:ABC transporter substrate-binding protein [Nocardia mexicana]|uniref:Iron complex transport system substrate-binding protein n=1 Tax=Nocardia mexicana TaxID=279262 RepID=A0A370HAG0_9NOCA|nr:iron-siderophore ABC transporter substrate-binding protein [Nocardia mexicana]RDI53932.1 iron complex transport system substrate-binding protein [Nocardia mexicana]